MGERSWRSGFCRQVAGRRWLVNPEHGADDADDKKRDGEVGLNGAEALGFPSEWRGARVELF